MGINKKLQEGGLILSCLGVLGFIGLVWLMIFGNLSGNLGFRQTVTTFTNQTITLSDAGNIPAGVSGQANPSLTGAILTNASSGATVPASNYTISGVRFSNANNNPTGYNGSSVNVSYVGTYDSNDKLNTDRVINQTTGGFSTFFGFSNVLFTIGAIVLLIFMLVGLLAVVMKIAKGFGGSKESSGL